MNKASFSAVFFCSLNFPASAIADTTANTVSGQVRLGYINTEDNTGNKNETLALGGKFGYNSKSYQGFRFGGTIYTTNALGGIDDEALFLAADKASYSILGETYVNATFGTTHITLGRQELDTPFADTDDIGMIPNTFESLAIDNTTLNNTSIVFHYLYRQAGVDALTPEKFSKINGNKGVSMLGIRYEIPKQWRLHAWHYNAKGGTDISYLEAEINPFENTSLAIQYAKQNGAGFDGKVWGASAEYALGNITLSTAYNKVSSGQVSNGFGGGPFFTSAEDHTIAEADKQKATALGIEYAINKLTFTAYHVDFRQGDNELDLIAAYEFNDALSAELIYSDFYAGGEMTRAFINYNF